MSSLAISVYGNNMYLSFIAYANQSAIQRYISVGIVVVFKQHLKRLNFALD